MKNALVDIARNLRSRLQQRKVARSCSLQIDPTARVRFAGLVRSPPEHFTIGAYSMFDGDFDAERPGTIFRIGARTFVGASHFVCAERIEVGDDVLISWGCTIVDHHSHPLHWCDREPDVVDYYYGRKSWSKVKVAPVRIGNKAWIGFDAVILAGVTIGEGAVVGCRSVVTRDVEPFTVVAGTPARVIKREIS